MSPAISRSEQASAPEMLGSSLRASLMCRSRDDHIRSRKQQSRFSLRGRAAVDRVEDVERELARFGGKERDVAAVEIAAQDLLRERRLYEPRDRALHRPRAEREIVSARLQQVFDRRRIELEPHAALAFEQTPEADQQAAR